MINISEVPRGNPLDAEHRYRLRIEGVPADVDKVELRSLLSERCQSVKSIGMERSRSEDGHTLKTAFVSVTSKVEKDELVRNGLLVKGLRLIVVSDGPGFQKKVSKEENKRKVFVTNIPFGTSDQALMKFFCKFGPCDPDAIGRHSKDKELTFCTITFHDESTARMLISKKTLDFNGRKLKLLAFDGAERKLSEDPKPSKEKKPYQINKSGPGSQNKLDNFTNTVIYCPTCKQKLSITKCTCQTESNCLFATSPSNNDRATTAQTPTSNLGYSPDFSIDHRSPPFLVPSQARLTALNLFDHLRSVKEVPMTVQENDLMINQRLVINPPTDGQDYLLTKKGSLEDDRILMFPNRPRAHSEVVSMNHTPSNLRFNIQR